MLKAIGPVETTKASYVGVKKALREEPLPQTVSENGLQKDMFQKQNKLNSICALTDGYATPMMA